jgi:quaternary ammonium compound-resistance protein SugE
MSWLLLAVAGLFEVGWASALPATNGLTRPAPTALFVGLLAASMIALALATRTIPVATAYAVWVGIGAAGAAIVGMMWRGDPATPLRIFCLALLMLAIVGLKLSGSHGAT